MLEIEFEYIDFDLIVMRHAPLVCRWPHVGPRLRLAQSLIPAVIDSGTKKPTVYTAPEPEARYTAEPIAKLTGSIVKIEKSLSDNDDTSAPEELVKRCLESPGIALLITHRKTIAKIIKALVAVRGTPLQLPKKRRLWSNQAIVINTKKMTGRVLFVENEGHLD